MPEGPDQIATAGLASDAAQQFIARMPSVEASMPRLSFAEIAGEAEPRSPSSWSARTRFAKRLPRATAGGGYVTGIEALQAPSRNDETETTKYGSAE